MIWTGQTGKTGSKRNQTFQANDNLDSCFLSDFTWKGERKPPWICWLCQNHLSRSLMLWFYFFLRRIWKDMFSFRHNRLCFACCYWWTLWWRWGIIHLTDFHKSIWRPWKYGSGTSRRGCCCCCTGGCQQHTVVLVQLLHYFPDQCHATIFLLSHLKSGLQTELKCPCKVLPQQILDISSILYISSRFIIHSAIGKCLDTSLQDGPLPRHFALTTINKRHKTVATNKSQQTHPLRRARSPTQISADPPLL